MKGAGGGGAWKSFGGKCADVSIARHAGRGFINEEYECVDYFARDAWIACDRHQSLDGGESFAQEGGGAALVLDLFGQARELREQNSALPFRHPVGRAHQRSLEIVVGTAASRVNER